MYLFCTPEGHWEESYATDQSSFSAQAIELGKDVDTVLAAYDIGELLEEIQKADVIFINGGFKGHLRETLLSIGVEQLRKMFTGKTIVGISAGANMLTKYYYSMASGGIREGINFLPIKLLTHSNGPDSEEHKKLLQNYKEKLPVISIAEEEYITV